MAMTSSSLAPILRYRSSCLPACASNDHLAPFFTMGTGNGQFPLPTMTKARLPFFGSIETLCFSRAWAAKSAARCRSCGGSPVRTMSSLFGPKMATRPGTSNFSAAAMRASAAFWGVSKLLGPATELAGAVASGFAAGSCPAQRNDAERHAQATAPPIQSNLRRFLFGDLDLMSGLLWAKSFFSLRGLSRGKHRSRGRLRSTNQPMRPAFSVSRCLRGGCSYLRRPPPPRPPPPRDPKLEEPRLLAARALDPLNPLEPPPKALWLPPLERDPVLLAPPPAARLPADSRAAAARSLPAAPPPVARSAERASRLADLSPARASWLAALSPVRASRVPPLSPALA